MSKSFTYTEPWENSDFWKVKIKYNFSVYFTPLTECYFSMQSDCAIPPNRLFYYIRSVCNLWTVHSSPPGKLEVVNTMSGVFRWLKLARARWRSTISAWNSTKCFKLYIYKVMHKEYASGVFFYLKKSFYAIYEDAVKWMIVYSIYTVQYFNVLHAISIKFPFIWPNTITRLHPLHPMTHPKLFCFPQLSHS